MVRMIRRAEKALIAHDRDGSHLHLRPFVDVEDQLHRVGRRDAFVGRLHRGELVPVRGQQALEHHFGARDFRGIELAFDRKPDFLVLECVENVRLGNRFVSLVLDPPDDRPLGHVENDDFAVRDWSGSSSTSRRMSSKNCVFHNAWKSRRTASSL